MESLKEKLPFHCIITGPTNCGKTKFLVDQIREHFRGTFDNIVLICPTFAHNKTYHGFGHEDKKFFVMAPSPNDAEDINNCLKICSTLFEDTNTLLILDDCAVSKDLKKRSNEFVNLAFSGRHKGLSVWVLTQQLNSVSKPFRANVACVVSFHNPSESEMKSLFEDFLSLEKGDKTKVREILKKQIFETLHFSETSFRMKKMPREEVDAYIEEGEEVVKKEKKKKSKKTKTDAEPVQAFANESERDASTVEEDLDEKRESLAILATLDQTKDYIGKRFIKKHIFVADHGGNQQKYLRNLTGRKSKVQSMEIEQSPPPFSVEFLRSGFRHVLLGLAVTAVR